MRFSGFDDEWIEEKLGNLVQIKSGECTKNLITGIDNSIPYFKVEQLNNSLKYQIKTPYFINDKSKIVNKGSIIFPKRGAAILLNKIRILNQDSFMDTNLMTLTPNNKLYNEFLYYFIYKENLSKIADTTSIPQLNNKHIKPYPIKLPSFEEQLKISKFISSVDKKVALLSQNLEIFNDFKKGLLQQIFTQKLRFDFDGEWKNIPFKKLLKEINEKTTVNNQHEILSSTKEGIFTQKEYFANRNVASKDNTGYKILRKNQIVLSPQNLWMGNINVNTEFDIGIVSPSYKIYETTDLVDINYFKHIIKLPRLIYEYTCASEQGASIVRRNLNKELFNEITIKVPSSNEQEKIGKMFDAYDEKIKNIDKNIQDIKEFKKGLIQQMFVVRINWRCNFKLVKSPSFNKHLLILKNKIIFIIIK